MENIETKVEEIETEEAIEESVDTDFEGLELTEDELVEKLDLLSLIDIDKLNKFNDKYNQNVRNYPGISPIKKAVLASKLIKNRDAYKRRKA